MTHVKTSAIGAVVLAAVFGVAVRSASTQSLGDLAKKEEARRKAVAGSGKVYTNDSLRPTQPTAGSEPAVDSTSPSAQPAVPAPAAGTPPASDTKKDEAKADAKPDAPKKDEAYWRQRLQAERDAIDRSKVLIEALQSRVSALQTDFVNRDDPASRGQLAAERQRALAELDRMKKEIEQRTKAVADIQEEARRAGAPAAWYR
jgi:hypothetical protein